MKRNIKTTKRECGIQLEKGSGAHMLVSRLLKMGVDSGLLRKATKQPRQCIAAIRAHNTMGTYEK
jgi:hypothetical protein